MAKRPGQPVDSSRHPGRVWVVVSLILVLGIVSGIRIRLLNLPLERDEGEYAYVGQLMLEGVPPYREAYTMKWPGTAAAYAATMVLFGETTAGIHIGLILINLATAFMVWVLARRIFGESAGAAAAATYALLSICRPTLGLAAHATHYVMLSALGGILVLQNTDNRTSRARFFWAGLLFGIAALMKQPGAVFGVFGALWIVWNEVIQGGRNWQRLAARLGLFTLGGSTPFLVMLLILVRYGVFRAFWLWTFHNAGIYATGVGFQDAMANLARMAGFLWKEAPGLWGVAALGVPFLLFERPLGPWRLFVIGFALFSFLAVSLDGHFRGHYFLLLLPAVGLLAGAAIHGATQLLARHRLPFAPATIPILVLAIAGAWSLLPSRNVFFVLSPADASSDLYGVCPFPEAVDIGAYLATNCPPTARIAVLGSEPEIYFYSNRRSATGYLYTYPLMDPGSDASAMQMDMIQEVEKADPDYLVSVQVDSSWMQTPASGTRIFYWLDAYSKAHFDLVALVEMLSNDRADYKWSAPKGSVSPHSDTWLAIYKRKPVAGAPPGIQ